MGIVDRCQGIVERGVFAIAVKEAVVAAIIVVPDNLTVGIDAVGIGHIAHSEGLVERSEASTAVQEAVWYAAAVQVIPDDLAPGVDAMEKGAPHTQRIVQRRVHTAAV